MSNRFYKTTIVILPVFIFCIGCQKSYMSEEGDTATGLNPGQISAPTGFTEGAFEAAGGWNAWTEAKKLGFDCVVTFYESDGAFYLTQLRYDIYLWSNAIEISGREPAGDYTWLFSDGKMTVLHSTGQIDQFPPGMDRQCFAQAIMKIATAPVSLLESSSQLNRQDAAVKKYGKWYYPIHKTGEASGETVFYQDRDTRLVSMVRTPCSEMNGALVVRGYDYQAIEKGGPLVPTRIEVSSTDVVGVSEKRLAKIDCHSMMQTK